jgi:CrcB protein
VSSIALLAALGAGAIGALARYGVALLVDRTPSDRRRPRLPWAVLVVNVAGSALGGAVLGLAERGALDADLRLVLLGGLAGGLTTFSTLSVETVQLVQDGRSREAVVSVAANVVLGVAAAALGWLLTAGA